MRLRRVLIDAFAVTMLLQHPARAQEPHAIAECSSASQKCRSECLEKMPHEIGWCQGQCVQIEWKCTTAVYSQPVVDPPPARPEYTGKVAPPP